MQATLGERGFLHLRLGFLLLLGQQIGDLQLRLREEERGVVGHGGGTIGLFQGESNKVKELEEGDGAAAVEKSNDAL